MISSVVSPVNGKAFTSSATVMTPTAHISTRSP